MRAVAVYPRQKSVRVIEVPPPSQIAAEDVLVRILEVGVCGTDREISAFAYGEPPPGDDKLILGHESLGEVVDVGSAVTRVAKGDLVMISVRRPCDRPECLPCRHGRQDFCVTGAFLERGIKGLHGFMTELVVERQEYVYKLPPELREIGVLTEPLSIAEKGVGEADRVQKRLPWRAARPTALVLGAGPVGQLGAMKLMTSGYRTLVYSRDPEDSPKAKLVRKSGATYVSSLNVKPAELAARVREPIDLIYEAAGAGLFAIEAMQALAPNGIYVFTAVPGRKDRLSVDAAPILRDLVLKNQVVFGTVNAGPEAYTEAIKDLSLFLHEFPEAVRGLITGRFKPEEAPELVSGPHRQAVKSVVTFARPAAT